MYCQRCGRPLRNDARFCGVCGAQADPQLPAPGQPSQPAPAGGYPAPAPYQAQPGNPPPAPYGQPPQPAYYPAQPAYPQPVQHLQPLPAQPASPGYWPAQPQPAPGYPQPYYQQPAAPAGYPAAQQAQPMAPAANPYRPAAPQPVQAPQSAGSPYGPGPGRPRAAGVSPGGLAAPVIAGATYPVFGRRAAAFLIDITLVLLFAAAAIVPMSGVLSGANTDTLTIVLAVIVSLASLAFLLWYPIIQPGRSGQTLGKRLLNIKVIDHQGNPPGIGKMAVRFLIGYPLCAIIMGVGFLVPLWDVQRQALDDKLVDTYVINA